MLSDYQKENITTYIANNKKYKKKNTTILFLTSIFAFAFFSNFNINPLYAESEEEAVQEQSVSNDKEDIKSQFQRRFARNNSDDDVDQISDKNLDVVLLIDSSGSMQETDPKRLRDEGVRLFLEFLRDGDKVSIVQFADGAKVLMEPAFFHKDGLESITSGLGQIENTGIYTDLYSAVSVAKRILVSEDSNMQKAIVLFSDGKLEPNEAVISRDDALNKLQKELLPSLNIHNIKLYTLSFSEMAERDLLKKMAEKTNALSWYAEDASTIHEAFSKLFLAVKKPQILPISKKGLRLDNQIEEATFYINKRENNEIIIVTPSGKRIQKENANENVKWFSGNRFDIITVTNPETGLWKFLGEISDKDFATVLTRLKLVTSWSSNIYAQEPQAVKIRIYDNNKPLALPDLNKVARVAYRISSTDKVAPPIAQGVILDDGKGLDEKALDGIFTAKVQVDEPGEYELWALIKTPTFERHQKIPFYVRPKLISLDISEGANEDNFVIKLSKEALKNMDYKVSLIALSPSLEELSITPQKTNKNGEYVVSSKSLKEEGDYLLLARYESSDVTTATLQLEYQNKLDGVPNVKDNVNKEVGNNKDKNEVDEKNALKENVEKEEKQEGQTSLPNHLIILFCNLAFLTFLVLSQRKKKKKDFELNFEKLELGDDIQECVSSLKQLVGKEEVDIDDDAFIVDNQAGDGLDGADIGFIKGSIVDQELNEEKTDNEKDDKKNDDVKEESKKE